MLDEYALLEEKNGSLGLEVRNKQFCCGSARFPHTFTITPHLQGSLMFLFHPHSYFFCRFLRSLETFEKQHDIITHDKHFFSLT